MHLSIFNPMISILALLGLFGGVGALVLIVRWFERVSSHPARSPASAGGTSLHPLLFWISSLPIALGVICLGILLVSSFVIANLFAAAF
jgi:hypothetical protein